MRIMASHDHRPRTVPALALSDKTDEFPRLKLAVSPLKSSNSPSSSVGDGITTGLSTSPSAQARSGGRNPASHIGANLPSSPGNKPGPLNTSSPIVLRNQTSPGVHNGGNRSSRIFESFALEEARSLMRLETPDLMNRIAEDSYLSEAMLRIGIMQDELYKMSKEKFERDPVCPWQAPIAEMTELRFREYESDRLRKLAAIVTLGDELRQDSDSGADGVAHQNGRRVHVMTPSGSSLAMGDETFNLKVLRAVEVEKKRLEKMSRARAKYELALQREAEEIEKRRIAYEERQRETEKRQQEVQNQLKKKRFDLKKKGEDKRRHLQSVRLQKHQIEKEKAGQAALKRQETEHNAETRLQMEKKQKDEQSAIAKTELEEARKIKSDIKAQMLDQRLKRQKDTLDKKDEHLKTYLGEKELQKRLERERRRIQHERRQKTVMHAQNAAKYKHGLMKDKLDNTIRKTDHIKELKHIVAEERQKIRKEELIQKHKMQKRLQEQKADMAPGPGAYELRVETFSKKGAVGWRPETTPEVTISSLVAPDAASLPGPGEYKVPSTFDGSVKGGTFAHATHETILSELAKTASRLPGPGSYKTETSGTIKGAASFNRSPSPTSTSLEMARAAAIPGPGDYNSAASDAGKPLYSPRTNNLDAALKLRKSSDFEALSTVIMLKLWARKKVNEKRLKASKSRRSSVGTASGSLTPPREIGTSLRRSSTEDYSDLEDVSILPSIV